MRFTNIKTITRSINLGGFRTTMILTQKEINFAKTIRTDSIGHPSIILTLMERSIKYLRTKG